MAWGKNGTTSTLVSSNDDLDITDMSGLIHNTVLSHTINTGGSDDVKGHINNDAGSNYAYRYNSNGGSDVTATSTTEGIPLDLVGTAQDQFDILYIIGISGEEKLVIVHGTQNGGAGAGNAPNRAETVAKYVPTDLTDTINGFYINNIGAGTFDTNSNISALGSDLTPAVAVSATIQDGLIFEETDTNKHYLLDDGTWTEI
jgi:hypothetical protein